MKGLLTSFEGITSAIERHNSGRESLRLDAFRFLEARHPAMAGLVLESVEGRVHAALWMCTRRRVFGGRMAYELLADGDDETVWSEVMKLGESGSSLT
jgi:hypothetical protein